MLTLHGDPAFFYNPEPLALGWYHLQWAGPSYINGQSRRCPTDLPTLKQSHGLHESLLLGDCSFCQTDKHYSAQAQGVVSF